MFTRIKNKLLEKKKIFVPIFLFSGIIFDLIFIDRPDKLYVNLIIIGHLLLTAICILFLNRKVAIQNIFFVPTTFVLQFSFGALAGSLLVLYTQSGTIAGSLIFFLIFVAFLVGNEFVHNQYEKVYTHLSVWYFLLITYCNIFVPILTKSFSLYTFTISMSLSLAVALIFLRILYIYSNKELKNHFVFAILGIVVIFILYCILYIYRIIPPVPLSIKNIGIYHYIEKKADGDYFATYESKRWWQVFRQTSSTFHIIEGQPAYCFSSTFAPSKLNVQIAHRWQYRKDSSDPWSDTLYLKFPILGGRDSGYRAYTQKSNTPAGEWRCDVETADGVLIGRVDFTVVRDGSLVTLKERILR